jgi:hypothetical protein
MKGARRAIIVDYEKSTFISTFHIGLALNG